MKKLHSLILSALACLTGCEQKQDGMIYTDGPGSEKDIGYLKKTWGVELPEGDCWKVKRGDGLMVYMSSHDRLQPYQDSIDREWKNLEDGEVFSHKSFVVDGSKDLKIQYTRWDEENTSKLIFIDYSTAIVCYMVIRTEVGQRGGGNS